MKELRMMHVDCGMYEWRDIEGLEKSRPNGRFSLGPAGSWLGFVQPVSFSTCHKGIPLVTKQGLFFGHQGPPFGHQGL